MVREVLTSPIGHHIWRSMLSALLALILRSNSARVRYAVWFAASMKFLIPFAPLVMLGSVVKWRPAPIAMGTVPGRIEIVFEPAFAPVPVAQPHPRSLSQAIAILAAI